MKPTKNQDDIIIKKFPIVVVIANGIAFPDII